MNVNKLLEKLKGNDEDLHTLLESLGFTDIKYNTQKKQFRFARADGRNASSVLLDANTTNYTCFSENTHGNIITLVMDKRHCSFPEALNYIARKLGYDKSELNQEIRLPFNGFYKGIQQDSSIPEANIKKYDKSILEEYVNKYSTKFFNDHIDYITQEKFNIGYDFRTNRITVPEYSFDGDLVGIMGRANYDCDKSSRWLPIIPCSRALTLYGFHQNYKDIKNHNICVIGESEKFPMQLNSFGCHIGLGTCGCHISDVQARHIKGLMIKNVVLAYDEGLDEEQVREEAKKLKFNNGFIDNKVGYIYDRENDILRKDSKDSPSDLGQNAFKELLKKHTYWI